MSVAKTTQPLPAGTDLSQWRLRVSDLGAQTWEFVGNDETAAPQTACEQYWLGLDEAGHSTHKTLPPSTPREAAMKCLEFIAPLQTPAGHFACEYGGPLFLLPFLVLALHISDSPLGPEQQAEVVRYLCSQQNADGGWGLHVEGHSTMFGTVLHHVALRLLGASPESAAVAGAREWMRRSGADARSVPTWAKFWLALLNVYSWEGLHPLVPELLLLPEWAPLHPRKLWCHCRQVFLPMAYLYGKRWQLPLSAVTKELRHELFHVPYDSVDWPSCRSACAPTDLFQPHSLVFRAVSSITALYESYGGTLRENLRERALEEAERLIDFEDEYTSYLDLGPVNKAVNVVVAFVRFGRDSAQFQAHRARVADYLWLTPRGLLMNGTNGTQLWDAALLTKAIDEARLGREPQFRALVRSLHGFIDRSQIRSDPPDAHRNHRHASHGAWPFSTREQTYTVSDCTASGLMATVVLQRSDRYASILPSTIDDERLYRAVDVLLGMQNPSGGFASYELIRGSPLLEMFNGFELFGDIMVEYPYTECTASVVMGLATFQQSYPGYRRSDVDACMRAAVRFIESKQEPSGGWYGAWGVCYTYGTWFALEALAAAGHFYHNSRAAERGCAFLLERQDASTGVSGGGWGESFSSCERHAYIPHPNGGQVVNTAWAVLALLAADCPHPEQITRGVHFLMRRQRADGSYDSEGIEGVFNKSCAITYPNYKFIFPIWALGRYAAVYDDPVLRVPLESVPATAHRRDTPNRSSSGDTPADDAGVRRRRQGSTSVAPAA